jgi:hypothetical protein
MIKGILSAPEVFKLAGAEHEEEYYAPSILGPTGLDPLGPASVVIPWPFWANRIPPDLVA